MEVRNVQWEIEYRIGGDVASGHFKWSGGAEDFDRNGDGDDAENDGETDMRIWR